VFDPGPSALVFLIALFFAIVGVTMYIVAVRRGVLEERRRSKDG
jgi:hypothetical protein